LFDIKYRPSNSTT